MKKCFCWLAIAMMVMVSTTACRIRGGSVYDDSGRETADSALDGDNDGVPSGAGDCDDNDASVYPGATELCDGVDNNCDGEVDEGCSAETPTPEAETPTPEPTPPLDGDGDGYSEVGGDCDDTSSAVHPGAVEGCDSFDSDCDGAVDEGCEEENPTPDDTPEPTETPEPDDLDGDGYTEVGGDCDDTDATVYPGAEELCNDATDSDCDGNSSESESGCVVYSDDADGDGYCENSPCVVSTMPAGDCDDTDARTYPGAAETCDGLDNDCDGDRDDIAEGTGSLYYQDSDGDGYGTDSEVISACSRPAGYAVSDDDCNDGNASIHPGATETCNNVDDDCDGAVEDDTVCNPDCAATAFWWGADFNLVTWASEGQHLISNQDDPDSSNTVESSTPWTYQGQLNICAGATSSADEVMAAVNIGSNTCVAWDTANAYDDDGDGFCVPIKKAEIDHTP